ncbi:BioY family protein [Enterococcus canis]|uniref:Biotin transporter n=1 Tax=Enterococcus canis TaxID=214095 RepID=A0A1L8RGE2_9ENTE|nr:biotin transporter BioY [Enterococcus canis]OJG18775.1 BioY family protein [Enterococcus canis]
MMKITLRQQILAATFAVVIGILSQLTLPLTLVPLTGQTFAIGLAVTLLGKKNGTYAILIYLLLGLIGVPVFAGMSAGFSVLAGPTGGYLVGFIFNGLLTGAILEKRGFTYTWAIVANLVGAIVTLFFGTIWLKVAADLTWAGAMSGGFIPFILPGVIKAIAAAYLGILIRQRLVRFAVN